MFIHAHAYINKVRARTYDIEILWVGYSRDIRGIFVGYSWGIRMYRVCVGYVSGMYRECVGGFYERRGCAIKFRAEICRYQKKAVPL